MKAVGSHFESDDATHLVEGRAAATSFSQIPEIFEFHVPGLDSDVNHVQHVHALHK
jgi:hypothetical protein